MTPSNYYFLNKALSLSRTSSHRWRHAALVVKQGRILGQATNLLKNPPTTPGIPLTACSAHAEMRALRRAGFPRKPKVYVARIARDNITPMLSKPCSDCQTILDSLRCKVYYT